MAITTETSLVEYTGNGTTTAFAVPFLFLANSHLVVKKKPSGGSYSTLVEGTDYTVVGAGVQAGGTVTCTVAPASGATLQIARTVPLKQDMSFRTQGSFSPAVHEDALDYGCMVDQQFDRRLDAIETLGTLADTDIGAGLKKTGSVLDVGQGLGIVVNADDVAVNFSDAAPVAVSVAAANSGTVNKASREDHRHQASTGAPANLSAGATASEGAGSSLARADHVHGVPVAAPADVTKAAAAEGVSTSFSRADHKHDVTTATGSNLAVGQSAAEGSNTSLARSDHAHGLATGTPVAVSDSTNAAGSANTFTFSDHVHAHGDRGGGSLHAVATTTVAGFLDGAGKTKLNAIGETFEKTETTASNLPTPCGAYTPTDGTVITVEATVAARRSTGAQGAGYRIAGTFRRTGATITQIGTATVWGHEDDAVWGVAFLVSGTQVLVVVTGAPDVTINWATFGRVFTAT